MSSSDYDIPVGALSRISHRRTFDELPKEVRDYVTFIEDLADVPVSMIAPGL